MTTSPSGTPAGPAAVAATDGTRSATTAARLVGVDIARGLAVLGMFVAHLGDDGPGGRHDPEWFVVADGRSAALFAFLAGVSLALAHGREILPTGLGLLRARIGILVRAGVLLLLGWVLVALGTPVLVILPAYAVMFAFATAAIGLRRRWLVVGAALAAFVSPLVIALLTTAPAPGSRSPLSRLTGLADPVKLPMDELVTGPYPALVYMAYVLLGMAVGRSRLTAARTQAALLGIGVGLAVLGWGTSRLALDAVGPGASPLTLRLLRADAHENSALEVLGNCGTSLAAVGLFLLLTRPGAAPGRILGALLSPLAAVGAMSLSVYSAHLVAIFVLGNEVVWQPESNAVLVWFVVVALVAAWLWRTFLGRGPLERVVRGAVRAVVPAR